MFGIAASQQVISIELSLTEDSEQEAKILCSESGSREDQEMPNCGVSSVAFSNRQVLNRLGLQSATTIVMMVLEATKLANVPESSNLSICRNAERQPRRTAMPFQS